MTLAITFATNFLSGRTSGFAVKLVGLAPVASTRKFGTLDMRRFGRNLCNFVSQQQPPQLCWAASSTSADATASFKENCFDFCVAKANARQTACLVVSERRPWQNASPIVSECSREIAKLTKPGITRQEKLSTIGSVSAWVNTVLFAPTKRFFPHQVFW